MRRRHQPKESPLRPRSSKRFWIANSRTFALPRHSRCRCKQETQRWEMHEKTSSPLDSELQIIGKRHNKTKEGRNWKMDRMICRTGRLVQQWVRAEVPFLGPATTQNLVVKFDGELCGGVVVKNVSDDFPRQMKLENVLPNFAGSSPPISPKTSPTSLWKSLALRFRGRSLCRN